MTTTKFDETNEPGVTNQINASVEKAATEFDDFETKVMKLINVLKNQHDTMIAFNDARLQTAKEFEAFVANTPLTKAMGEVDTAKAKAAVFKKHEHSPTQNVEKKVAAAKVSSEASMGSNKTPIASVKSSKSDEKMDVSIVSDGKSVESAPPPEAEELTVDTALMSTSRDSEETPDAADVKASFVEEETPAIITEEEAYTPFEAQVVKGSEYSHVDISNLSIAQASHKLTLTYAEQYQSAVIDYAEEWLQSVTSRIKSRIIEFDKLRSSLDHYVAKVDELRTESRRRESNKKKLSPKKAERHERNELKLNGAREAHHTYGQSLYLLMDEVTNRGWRDIYPLILNSIHFDLNYSSDQSKLYAKLETIAEMLDEVATSDPNNLDIEGRLELLKKATPEEIYTGKEYSKVHPVLKAV